MKMLSVSPRKKISHKHILKHFKKNKVTQFSQQMAENGVPQSPSPDVKERLKVLTKEILEKEHRGHYFVNPEHQQLTSPHSSKETPKLQDLTWPPSIVS